MMKVTLSSSMALKSFTAAETKDFLIVFVEQLCVKRMFNPLKTLLREIFLHILFLCLHGDVPGLNDDSITCQTVLKQAAGHLLSLRMLLLTAPVR